MRGRLAVRLPSQLEAPAPAPGPVSAAITDAQGAQVLLDALTMMILSDWSSVQILGPLLFQHLIQPMEWLHVFLYTYWP